MLTVLLFTDRELKSTTTVLQIKTIREVSMYRIMNIAVFMHTILFTIMLNNK